MPVLTKDRVTDMHLAAARYLIPKHAGLSYAAIILCNYHHYGDSCKVSPAIAPMSHVPACTAVVASFMLHMHLLCPAAGEHAGGRMAFVWEVLRRVCDGLDRPLMLFVHDVERTLCGSFERYDAFEDAFGAGKVRAPKIQLDRAGGVDSLVLPLVLIGGCTLGESGTHLTSSAGCACSNLGSSGP